MPLRNHWFYAPLAAVCVTLAACSDAPPLATTLDADATTADIVAMQEVMATPQVASYTSLGPAIGAALASLTPLTRGDALAASTSLAEDTPTAIPLTALGKTYVWSPMAEGYRESQRTGAPGTGVRFLLYQLGPSGRPSVPVVEIGYVDVTEGATGVTVKGYTAAGATVLEYTTRLGAVSVLPSLTAIGTLGTGATRMNIDLRVALSLLTGSVTSTWTTEVPARGLRSTVQLAATASSATMGALMRAGGRKIELGGTIAETGGALTVTVGGKVFATLTGTPEDGFTATGASGAPLIPAEEAALLLLVEWFSVAFEAPTTLLIPIAPLLELPALPF